MADPNPFAQFVQPDNSAASPPAGAQNAFAQFVAPDSGAQEQAPAHTGQEIASDVGKQIATSPLRAAENIATAVPRLIGAAGSFVSPAIESLVAKVSPAKAAEMHQAEAERQAFLAANPAPSISESLPQPQTAPGKFAQSGSDFALGALAAPGSLVRNAAAGTVAGLASEGAGEATEGGPLEPYARIGAGLAGGVVGAKALAPKVAALTPEEVIAKGVEAYKSPQLSNVLIDPSAVGDISNDIISQLNKSRLNARLAPKTHAIIEDLATPVSDNLLHSFEDFQTTRQLLEKRAGNFSDPEEQAAASKAIKLLDQNFANLPQSALVSGDINAAANTVAGARTDYAAGKLAQRIQQKQNEAELRTDAAHSGGNFDNTMRQKMLPFLTNQKQGRGLTAEDFEGLENIVTGSPTGNLLRGVSKVMGGGGGLGALVAAGEGMRELGLAGAGIPFAGYALKKVGDAMTRNAANKVVQNILSRAPSAASLRPAVPGALSPGQGGLVGALLAGSRAIPPLASLPPLGQPQQPSQDKKQIQPVSP